MEVVYYDKSQTGNKFQERIIHAATYVQKNSEVKQKTSSSAVN
jgi:hypothetical protein